MQLIAEQIKQREGFFVGTLGGVFYGFLLFKIERSQLKLIGVWGGYWWVPSKKCWDNISQMSGTYDTQNVWNSKKQCCLHKSHILWKLLNMSKHYWRWTLNNKLGSIIWSCETVCVIGLPIVCFPKKNTKSPRQLERIENTSCPVEVVCFEEAKSSIGTCNQPPFVSEGFPGIPG